MGNYIEIGNYILAFFGAVAMVAGAGIVFLVNTLKEYDHGQLHSARRDFNANDSRIHSRSVLRSVHVTQGAF